ncbi:MAG: dephospho-CoA kinase [Opitutae bacterium]|nr:dephospho-CoA kinase [Opitutae bacterium]
MDFFPGKIVVGVTGGIACGKSTVCEKFGVLGWEVISTDSYAHNILSGDNEVTEKIVSRWGPKIKDPNGSIDKAELARVIFESSNERSWLEQLVHPKIRKGWTTFIETSDKSEFVVEVPLLFENNLHALFTKTISVHASTTMQNTRLQGRGLSNFDIQSRLKSQMNTTEKGNLADFVIVTDGNPEFVDQQINQFLFLLK